MEFYHFPFHIWDVILPIDELHHFSGGQVNHQPVDVVLTVNLDKMLMTWLFLVQTNGGISKYP
jgi:hypothetical protein